MVDAQESGSTVSSRLTGLLYGVVLSAFVYAGTSSSEQPSKAAQPARTAVSAPAPAPTPTPAPSSSRTTAENPDKKTMAAYLAAEWNLGRAYASQVASAVLVAAQRYRLDPMLLLAVAATESRLQHSVGNPGGGVDPMKPYGIMQVAGRYHTEKFPGGVVRRTTVLENVDIGAKVLTECLALERGNERRALLRYNGSLHISDKYYRKVSRFKQQLTRELNQFQDSGEQSSPA